MKDLPWAREVLPRKTKYSLKAILQLFYIKEEKIFKKQSFAIMDFPFHLDHAEIVRIHKYFSQGLNIHH